MIAMLNNQMFYRTVEEIGNDCNQMFYRTIGDDCNVMLYRTVEEIGNDCC